jgi:hypothetical protein
MHTPGPFHITGFVDETGNYLHIGANASLTVLASMNESHPDTKGNADLFAAAPDMLTALKDCRNALYADNSADGWKEIIDAADMVIAKADGRS